MPPLLPPLALAYHGVAVVPRRDDPHGLFVAPSTLTRHVRLLRRVGYRLVRFGELASAVARGQGRGLAALTFDDGLADNLTVMAPLMARLDAPATVFAVPDLLGGRHPDAPVARMLSVDGLARLAEQHHIEVGAHSATHRDLTALSYEEARADLRRAKESLEDIVGRPVRTAAYPYGRATAETARACRDAGYEAACRTSGEGSWDDPWNLPRQDMDGASSAAGLLLKAIDAYEPAVATTAGRAVRRSRRILRGSRP